MDTFVEGSLLTRPDD